MQRGNTFPLFSKQLSWLPPCSLREGLTYCPLLTSSYKYPLLGSPWSRLTSTTSKEDSELGVPEVSKGRANLSGEMGGYLLGHIFGHAL